MSEKLIFNCTHGKEDAERATLPFVAANIAATAGQEAVVLCTVDAVWLGTEGGTDDIASPDLPALAGLYVEFVDNGGQVWLCGACSGSMYVRLDRRRHRVQLVHRHAEARSTAA